MEAQKAPKQTEAGRRRQQKSEYYAAMARSGGGPSPQVEAIPHQLAIPWPYSYNQLGQEFMQQWMEEGDQRGFSLRLTGWRNSHWKEAAE